MSLVGILSEKDVLHLFHAYRDLCLPKILSLFIYKELRTITNSHETAANDVDMKRDWLKMSMCRMVFLLFRDLYISRSNLILENLPLRHQLAVQQRRIKRPKFKNKDRIFLSLTLSKMA